MVTESNEVSVLRYASFWSRLLARTLDMALVIGCSAALARLFYSEPLSDDYAYGIYLQYMNGLSFVLFFFLYYPLLEASGGTIGKRIIKIQPVKSDSKELIGLKAALVRSLFLCSPLLLLIILTLFSSGKPSDTVLDICTYLFIMTSVIGPLAVIWNKRRQGMHDQWANVLVVQK